MDDIERRLASFQAVKAAQEAVASAGMFQAVKAAQEAVASAGMFQAVKAAQEASSSALSSSLLLHSTSARSAFSRITEAQAASAAALRIYETLGSNMDVGFALRLWRMPKR